MKNMMTRKTYIKTFIAAIAATALVAVAAPAPANSAEKGVKKYPLDTCIVSDNKLGSMGDPYVITYKKQVVKFCCKPCVKKFNKNPEKFLKKL